MSRTDKDMPWRIQLEDGRTVNYRGQRGTGNGQVMGGMYARIGRRTRTYWKSTRQAARQALLRREEPVPARPRGQARRDFY